ncbi:cupin domain-containing protein [Mycobacterium sp. RTGN5]|uniref:cupin domain-containing protein n=1 Tax=Mycobacterium sp. RTGN5 TaxID=3016522 RepID=UPI0029C90998|nr:cupin domain-containing protein [Mycobacterium sp. RTGN5]
MKPFRVSMAASVALGAVMLVPGSAAATPGVGVQGVVMSQATLNGKDYISREITIAPGGTTGWHYHPGQVFGVIREGTLTHYEGDCSVDGVYNAGDAITERSGTGYIHEGRNEGSTPLVMWVLYIDPAGSPLAVDMPNPGCPFE